jgi:iron(III) transport system permease protein
MIKVTLPLIAANLMAGALLAFAFAMLEVSDSVILAQKMVYFPITKAILELFQLLGDGKYLACALGVWAMVFLGHDGGGRQPPPRQEARRDLPGLSAQNPG